jgi:hypothetical protein
MKSAFVFFLAVVAVGAGISTLMYVLPYPTGDATGPDNDSSAATDPNNVVSWGRPDGTAAVELVQPTPNPALNRVILDTLRTWRFFPALERGRPVASTQEVRVRLEVC